MPQQNPPKIPFCCVILSKSFAENEFRWLGIFVLFFRGIGMVAVGRERGHLHWRPVARKRFHSESESRESKLRIRWSSELYPRNFIEKNPRHLHWEKANQSNLFRFFFCKREDSERCSNLCCHKSLTFSGRATVSVFGVPHGCAGQVHNLVRKGCC